MTNIKQLSKDLKLSYIRQHYLEEIKEAQHLKLAYEEFLERLLSKELESRLNNGIKNRIREAKFPQKKFLKDFKKSRI